MPSEWMRRANARRTLPSSSTTKTVGGVHSRACPGAGMGLAPLWRHASPAGRPRGGRAEWSTPSCPAWVVGTYQPERLPRALLTPSAAGRGGQGQQAARLHDGGEPHEQGLLGSEDFPD